jgi:putative transposase
MPDHLHALLSFDREKGMSQIIRNWKRYHASRNGVLWQDNFFDHRIRNEQEFKEKYAYIERNPVVKNLTPTPEHWPWKTSSWHPDAYVRFD